MKTRAVRPQQKPRTPSGVPPVQRFPLAAVEIETGPGDKRRTIPSDVIATVLEVAESLWYAESVGWFVADPERIALVAHNLTRMLGDLVCAGEGLDTSGVALVEKLTEEIEARTLASRGVNTSYYTIVVREPAVAS